MSAGRVIQVSNVTSQMDHIVVQSLSWLEAVFVVDIFVVVIVVVVVVVVVVFVVVVVVVVVSNLSSERFTPCP